MPYKEKESFKLYYSIGEVSEMLDVNASLLRFWEKEFDVVQPQKNKKGNRIYTEKDVQHLKLIHNLVKERGFTLEGAKKKLREKPDDLQDKAALVASLQEIRSMLMDLKESL